jgi:hypothetical protein
VIVIDFRWQSDDPTDAQRAQSTSDLRRTILAMRLDGEAFGGACSTRTM